MTLEALNVVGHPTVTEQVFQTLYERIVSLGLPPGARISEAEIAKQLDVSRQPVRDAFFRLSNIGLLTIRPQRATTIAPIEPEAVLNARFLRTAIEVETVRIAADTVDAAAIAELQEIIDQQTEMVRDHRKSEFHALDDHFHRRIFELTGNGFAWGVVRENKAHMDRVRYISLEFGAQSALDDHIAILEAIRSRDPERAVAQMRVHLSRICDILAAASRDNPALFRQQDRQ